MEGKLWTICPKCHLTADKKENYFYCPNCGWKSTDDDTIDISYKSELSCTLSNLYPHKFTLNAKPFAPYVKGDEILCLSMESFLQSLKISNALAQKYFCENYSGYIAYKAKLTMPDWRKDQILYWQGKKFERNSKDYINLITYAYDKLYESNIYFREVVLPSFKNFYLVHTMGSNDLKETVLTEYEYIEQLNRLIKKIK